MKPMDMIEQGRFLGEEFVLWLWFRGLTEGGASGITGDLSACFMDDSVGLASERGDVKHVSLDKGNPAESREAFDALSRGMRPIRAKFRILSGDMEWTFTFASGDLSISGMRMPPTQSKDPAGRLADRMFLLEEGLAHLDRRYAEFIRRRYEDSNAMSDVLQGWVKAGISGSEFELAEETAEEIGA